MISEDDGRWPTFLVIGAARAGTTSVHGLLRQHPQVLVPRFKEPNFFALRAMGVDLDALPSEQRLPWGPAVTDPAQYRRLFIPEACPASAVEPGESPEQQAALPAEVQTLSVPLAFGECSPVYLPVPGTAEQIFATIPDARLIAILRDPVDRAISHHAHNLVTGVEQELDFAVALTQDIERGEHSNYYRQGMYAMLLSPYIDRFGRDQVLLLDQSELAADPLVFMDRIFEHIGVEMGVGLRVADPALATQPSPVDPDFRLGLAARYRHDTRCLVDALGFEPARAWSSY